MSVEFDEIRLKNLLMKLGKIGSEVVPILQNAVDVGTAMVQKHAREGHFQVGTGIGSSKKALDSFMIFTNPDGTPRFKIRTGNLVSSIQATPSRKKGSSVEGEINVGQEYAAAVEYGAPGRQPFPFMRPALEETKHPWIKESADRIETWLKKYDERS